MIQTLRRSPVLVLFAVWGLMLAAAPVTAQSLPAGWTSTDIGAVGRAGSASGSGGAFTVRGAGDDIWNAADAFHFAYVPLTGDGAIVARVSSLERTHPWAKAGVMMRDTLADGSKHASMLVSSERGLGFQRRVSTGGASRHTPSDGAAPHWVRLSRNGDIFTAQASADGTSWWTLGTERIAMAATVYAGLAVTSHDVRVTSTAQFDQVVVSAGTTGGVTLARQPFLQQVTSTSAVIVWTTFGPEPGEVRYSRSGGATQTVTATSSYFPASMTGLGYDFYQHQARLWSLASGTAYDYEVFAGGRPAFGSRARLTTAPVPGSGEVRFIAFGDSGTGSDQQRQLAGVMHGDRFDLALHTGDIAYGNAGGTGDASFRTYNDWFFLVYERWLRRSAFYPSLGNHDSRASTQHGFAYLHSYVLPENGAGGAYPDHAERFYSFDYGPVHFIALDTELAFADPARRAAQVAWLEADLAATSQPWKVAYFHRTPYSAGGHHGSDLAVRQVFSPIFERYGVQLVLAAHEHIYERTIPWPLDRPAHERVVYVTTGGGGAPLYPAGRAAWTAHAASVHHYVRGGATSCTLTIEGVGLNGRVFDGVTLDRCGDSHEPPPDPPPGPTDWLSRDIGQVGVAGSASTSGGTVTLRGSGADIWGSADGFHFAYRTLEGDGEIVARVASLQAPHHWAKAGVMIRESLAAGSRHALMLVSRDRGYAFQRRTSTNGPSTHTDAGAGTAPGWVRLVRSGSTFQAFRSSNGTNWTLVGSQSIAMGATVYAGLALTSHDNASLATAAFDGVQVTETRSAWRSQDIGVVGRAGAAAEQGGAFTLDGSGADIWDTADGFHFAWQTLAGDGEIVARVATLEGTHHWAKAGVMIRESLTAGSRHAFMLVSRARGLAFQRRTSTNGASTHTDGGAGAAPQWVRLVRTGNTFQAFRSADGTNWTLVGSQSISMGATTYIGLALTSHDNSSLARARFDNVTVR
jgi:regulation of enolase protein 1 (concanavalin A-like superfamily)